MRHCRRLDVSGARRSGRPNTSAAAEALARAARAPPRYSSPMSEVLDMAAIAALVGDPARANILCALLDGRALTASELAYAAHVTPQTASGHLGKLASAQPDRAGAAGPPPLFPARRRACRRHDRKHLGGRRDRAAAAAADPHRRHDAQGAHVLRPHRGPSSASRSPTRCTSTATSNSPTTAAWSRRRARLSSPSSASISSAARGKPPRVLPPLRRLERTARAYRRCGRSRAGEPADGVALDRPQARHAARSSITPIGWSKIERTFGCSLPDHEPRPALRLVAG